MGGAEVKRKAPCHTQTDLDGWWKACGSGKKGKKDQAIFNSHRKIHRRPEKSQKQIQLVSCPA